MKGETLGPLRSCKKCGSVKPLEDFVTNYQCVNNKAHRCTECDNIDRQNKHLLAKYGITYEEKMSMLRHQNYTCPLCSSSLDDGKDTVVDHDHATGKVRQLLCRLCNTALGSFRDSPEILQRAIDYINYHKED